jgi:hypothetical protein
LDSPSWNFRWGQTNAYHGQAFMRGPDDEGWYERLAGLQAQRPGLVAFTVATQSLALGGAFRRSCVQFNSTCYRRSGGTPCSASSWRRV